MLLLWRLRCFGILGCCLKQAWPNRSKYSAADYYYNSERTAAREKERHFGRRPPNPQSLNEAEASNTGYLDVGPLKNP